MRDSDFIEIKPQVISLVSLHMADDPALLADVLVYPRTGMTDEEKIEYGTMMLMYSARMTTQLLKFVCEITGGWDADEVWRTFCALRADA